VATALWGAGGAIYLKWISIYGDAQEIVEGLPRGDPAAWVSLALFVAAWPAIYVCAKLSAHFNEPAT
jgi:hypothetical protein